MHGFSQTTYRWQPGTGSKAHGPNTIPDDGHDLFDKRHLLRRGLFIAALALSAEIGGLYSLEAAQ